MMRANNRQTNIKKGNTNISGRNFNEKAMKKTTDKTRVSKKEASKKSRKLARKQEASKKIILKKTA